MTSSITTRTTTRTTRRTTTRTTARTTARSKAVFFRCLVALLAAAGVFAGAACATDNGDSVHGPQFGPPPERPDGEADGPSAPEAGPVLGTDGGMDADADAAPPSMCTSGTVAVLAGGDTSLTGAVQTKGGAWTGAAIGGGAARSAPSLVAFGTGFAGLTRGATDVLQAVAYGTSWSASAIGAATTIGTPALTVVGAKAESAVLAGAPNANKFFRYENAGTSWSTTADPLTPPGGTQSFGPSAGTVAAAGTDLVFAQCGEDTGLYVQTWNGTWSVPLAINGAGTNKTVAPSLLAVDGTFDLVLLYGEKTTNNVNVVGYATRDAATKTWATAQVTSALAQTGEAMSVARISQFVVLVTFRGNNQRPYYMTGTLGAAAVSWSAPAPLLADMSTVDAAPAVAKGVCGDDAIAVFSSGGQVKASRYRGNSWTVPETVAGASGTRVSVATR